MIRKIPWLLSVLILTHVHLAEAQQAKISKIGELVLLRLGSILGMERDIPAKAP